MILEILKKNRLLMLKRSKIILNRCSSKIENATWQRIVRALYRKYSKEFFSFPAAKTNHHAFEVGLAYHTATMVRLADSMGIFMKNLTKVFCLRVSCCMI